MRPTASSAISVSASMVRDSAREPTLSLAANKAAICGRSEARTSCRKVWRPSRGVVLRSAPRALRDSELTAETRSAMYDPVWIDCDAPSPAPWSFRFDSSDAETEGEMWTTDLDSTFRRDTGFARLVPLLLVPGVPGVPGLLDGDPNGSELSFLSGEGTTRTW